MQLRGLALEVVVDVGVQGAGPLVGERGMLAVFILTIILSSIIPFKVFVPIDIIALSIGICILVGVIAGIVPAVTAARMDPVVAIRSN